MINFLRDDDVFITANIPHKMLITTDNVGMLSRVRSNIGDWTVEWSGW